METVERTETGWTGGEQHLLRLPYLLVPVLRDGVLLGVELIFVGPMLTVYPLKKCEF